MKTNFDPKFRKGNLKKLWECIGENTAVVNSIQVLPHSALLDRPVNESTQPQQEVDQEHGTKELGEILSGEDSACIQTLLVNQLKIGRACCPYEVIRVKVGAGYFPVTLVYDTGAQVSLCNFESEPLLIRSRPADKNATISTIDSTRVKPRKIHTLTLGDKFEIDAILIPSL